MISMTFPQMRRGECSRYGETVKLSPSQTAALALLLMRRGEPVSAEALKEAICADWEIGMQVPGEQAVIHTIMKLRQRLGYGAITTITHGPHKGSYVVKLPPTDAEIWGFSDLAA